MFSGAAVVLFAAASILLFQPLNPISNDYLSRAGIGDPAQMVWFLSYTPHAIAHGLNIFSTNLIDYPTGVDLASNTSVPLLGVLASPVTETLGPVAAFNLLVRLGIFLSATSMFFALNRWVDSKFARFVGGVTFGFGPYVIGQTIFNTHVNLLFVPLLPILMVILDELLVRQGWTWKRVAILLGITASAEMLIAPELLSDFGLVAGLVTIFLLLAYRQNVRAKLSYALKSLAGALVIFAIICGYLIRGMISGPNHIRGAVYSIDHLQSFHNSIVETFLPTMQQMFTTSTLSKSLQLPTRDLNELGGYLSIPLILFVLVSIVVFRRRRGVAPMAIGATIAFVLSLGPSVHLGASKIPLPEAVLMHLPLLKSTVPDRFALEAALGASMLFSIGIDGWIAASSRANLSRRRLLNGALAASVLLIIVALAPRIPLREQRLVWPTSIGPQISAHVGAHAVVLTYPYPAPPLNDAMAWQAEAGLSFSLLGGYATVPKADGDGQEWPRLQVPTEVQSYLTELEIGGHSHYPKIKAPTNSTALCTYVARYNVTDIVVLHHIVHSRQATAYLSSVPNTITFTDGDFTIYHLARSASGAASPCRVN